MRRAITLATMVCLLPGCALFVLATKGRSHPDVAGARTVAGLEQPVTIHRDAWGIPHIRTRTRRDAWFAVGYVHAQDRLFQADMNRRAVFGGLSAWQGEEAADLDGFITGLRLRQRAKESLAALGPAAREALEAYAEGINAGAADLDTLPVEYRLMGAAFEPWAPEDGLAPLYLASLLLAKNPMSELRAFTLRELLDYETANALLRNDPTEPPLDTYWDALREVQVGAYEPGYAALLDTFDLNPPHASNNWAVAPSRSADGSVIVANDPHLVQTVPSVWYVAEVRGGDLHLAGGTFPGSPFVLTGHDEQVAWAVTNTMADYVDLAVVELTDGGYVLEGERRPLEKVEAVLELPDGRRVTRVTWWTDVGPLVTRRDAPFALALRWHAFELEDHTADMLLALALSTRVEDVLAVANRPSVISQNVVTGDVHGRIAWAVSGVVPKRRAHTGRVPYLASRPGQGWSGWISELPREIDPARGYVHTANNRPDGPLSDAIASSFVPPWRYRRIGELLQPLTAATLDDMVRIQVDVLDLHAAALLDRLLEGPPPDGAQARRCHALLTGWDRVADADAVGMTVFAQLQKELLRAALVERLGEDGLATYYAFAAFDDTILMHHLDRFLPEPERAVGPALQRTCAALERRFGHDARDWAWGRVHALRLKHPFAAKSSLLGGWSMPEVPWGGTPSTVSQSGYHLGREDWGTAWMPSLRLVTPMSDPGKARVAYPGGQSGQPGSRWYRSLWKTWVSEETVPLYFHDADVTGNAVATLELRPPADGADEQER